MGTQFQQQVTEQRRVDRHPIRTLMPAQLLISTTAQLLPCRVHDVSASGLSVVIDAALLADTSLVFVTLHERFSFKVVWCQAVGRRQFRLGLTLAENERGLDHLFSCLLAG